MAVEEIKGPPRRRQRLSGLRLPFRPRPADQRREQLLKRQDGTIAFFASWIPRDSTYSAPADAQRAIIEAWLRWFSEQDADWDLYQSRESTIGTFDTSGGHLTTGQRPTTARNRFLWWMLFLVAAGSGGRASQEAVNVSIKEIAAIDPAEARQFFTSLKDGIRSDNRRSVCAVIQYPLRLQPDVTVRNASQCVQQYREIFTKYVTDAVDAQEFRELFVNSGGLMIGRGQIWFGRVCDDETCRKSRIRITGINNREREWPPAKGRLLMACHTDNERLEIIAGGESGAILRTWPRSRRASDPPGLELTNGVEGSEGSSGCTYKWWTFTSGATTFVVSEIGCSEKRPPKNAIGTLTINPETSSEKTSWCID